jgi:YYY domain-containing protein
MEYALVVTWLVAYGLLAALGLPVAARLLAPLPGRGAGFAVPVSLLLVGTGAYWVGQVGYGLHALVAGLALLVVVAAAVGLDRSALRDGRVVPAVDVDRRAVAEAGVVFVVGFLFVVALRALDPAVYAIGGEKFLDFGLLQSLERADSLPPEDVWFAGDPVRYYYGGHLLSHLLSMLTGTAPRYAYNLALAGFYAMLVAAAYDLGAALSAARGIARRPGGILAAFLVGVASNLLPFARYLLRTLPDGLARVLASFVAPDGPTAGELIASAQEFSYWDASRVVPGTITEFPLFSWLNGDLHAHMMGTPFVLLAAALGFAYYLTPAVERRRRLGLLLVAFPVLAGLQALVDTWSLPTVFGLAWLAVALAPAHPLSLAPSLHAWARTAVAERSLADELLRPLAALAVVGLLALPALTLAAPFLLASASGRSVAVLAAAERTTLGNLLLVHGAFLAVFVASLLARVRGRRLPLVASLTLLAAVAAVRAAPVALVAAPLLALGWVALRQRDGDGRSPVGYDALLVVAGAGLVALVEFVYVREQAGPLRLNTVFKTYMQVWVLWGTAAGSMLTGLLVRRTDGVVSARRKRQAASVLAAALVVSTGVYAGLAVSGHVAYGREEPTLDATAFVAEEHPEEALAIAWIDSRDGQPNMVSAPATYRLPDGGYAPDRPGMYDWDSSPAASLTGVPTVAGWQHEVGYRGSEAYFERVADVDRLYTAESPATRATILRRYDVEYVWVGPAERDRYGASSFGFASLSGVETAYRTPDGTVVVYAVDRDALPEN